MEHSGPASGPRRDITPIIIHHQQDQSIDQNAIDTIMIAEVNYAVYAYHALDILVQVDNC